MPHKGYKVATINEELYNEALKKTKSSTLSTAVRKLLPSECVDFSYGDRIIIRAKLEEVTIDRKVEIKDDIAKAIIYGFVGVLMNVEGISPVAIKVGREEDFVLSSISLINSALLPEQKFDKNNIYFGTAKTSLFDETVEYGVLIVHYPSVFFRHTIGMWTLRRLLRGNKILFDFDNYKICKIGE